MASAMLENVPRGVQKLQRRLRATSDPHRLRKYLKKLSALPMTAEVLAQTGPGPRRQDFGESKGAEGPGRGGLLPEGSYASGFPHQRAAPGSPANNPERGHTGLPELLTPPGRSPKRHQSTDSREKRPRWTPPASPPWEPSSRHGHLLASCPAPGAPAPLCVHYYGSPAELGATAAGHSPAKCQAQAPPDAPGLAQGDPLWGPQEEDREASWSSHRAHSKMRVHSGSGPACASLPHKMAFYECFRQVLSSNLDAIYDVSFIPDCVLRPVLEKCPPHELRRIETCNEGLAEKTDDLWKLHCHRDFKDQQPEEQESWRELHLRLQNARAQQLQDVTNRIRLARAKEPEARRSKLIPFSTVSTQRQKENVGWAEHPTQTQISPSGSGSGPRRCCVVPAAQTQACANPRPARVPLKPALNTRNRSAQKIPPLMAKTIRDYKKISRK
ncbi:elongin-A3-like [Erethizon dorsatum]